jgi:acyl carrier protein
MDLNFVELFNRVVDLAKPAFASDSHASSLEDDLKNLGIDSLDTIMLSIYFGDIYGVEEEVMKQMEVQTLSDLKAFLEQHATRKPETLEQALENIQ